MRIALVIIDLIEDYFNAEIWPNSRIPVNRNRLVSRTNELVGMARKAGVPVVWVRQEFEPDRSNVFLHMNTRGQSYAIAGTPGSALLPELKVFPDDTVLTKHRFSAFFGTKLDRYLLDSDVDTVILAGITSAWCVRSTATDAYQMDLNVILAKDCMDGFTRRDHEESIAAMDGYIATALTNHEIGEKLAG